MFSLERKMNCSSLLSLRVLVLGGCSQEVLSCPAAFCGWKGRRGWGGFTGVYLSHSWHYREIAKVKTAPTDSLKGRIAHLASGWLL